MGKRFGRNQRRKLREDLANAQRTARSHCSSLSAENARLRSRLDRSIEIDVEVLRDNSRMTYEARMAAHRMGYEGLHIARRIDERELYRASERDRFIEHMSRAMASELARYIGRKW